MRGRQLITGIGLVVFVAIVGLAAIFGLFNSWTIQAIVSVLLLAICGALWFIVPSLYFRPSMGNDAGAIASIGPVFVALTIPAIGFGLALLTALMHADARYTWSLDLLSACGGIGMFLAVTASLGKISDVASARKPAASKFGNNGD